MKEKFTMDNKYMLQKFYLYSLCDITHINIDVTNNIYITTLFFSICFILRNKINSNIRNQALIFFLFRGILRFIVPGWYWTIYLFIYILKLKVSGISELNKLIGAILLAVFTWYTYHCVTFW